MRADLPLKLRRLGAPRMFRCYNCGTCTSICPYAEEGAEFPRTLVRAAVLGVEGKILSSLGPWLCYQCGDCSQSCPRGAEPSLSMMAMRRYIIVKYSLGGLASMFYSTTSALIAYAVLSLVILLGILLLRGPMVSPVNLYTFLPSEVIHKTGISIVTFVVITSLIGIIKMLLYTSGGTASEVPLKRKLKAALLVVPSLVKELFTQARFLKCRNARRRYIAHMAIFWGCMAMLTATITSYLMRTLIGGIPLYPIPPQRILGTAGGIAVVYGTSYFIYKRLKGDEEYARISCFDDWALLILLLLATATGLLLTLSLYLGLGLATYILFISHIILALDLIITLPFTKLSHAVYRSVAMWVIALQKA